MKKNIESVLDIFLLELNKKRKNKEKKKKNRLS